MEGGSILTEAPRDSLDEEMLPTNYSEEIKSESDSGCDMPLGCD